MEIALVMLYSKKWQDKVIARQNEIVCINGGLVAWSGAPLFGACDVQVGLTIVDITTP